MARRFYLSSMETSVGHLLVTMPWKCLLMVIVSERTTAVGELLPLLMYQEIPELSQRREVTWEVYLEYSAPLITD